MDTNSNSVTIRAAVPGDERDVAAVHISSWQTTYRGLVPDSYLDDMSLERRTERWKLLISKPEPPQHTLVAVTDDGDIVGFATGGTTRHNLIAYDGELYALYLLKEWQRKGIGERLFRAIAEKLHSDGFRTLLICVLRENPSRAFYERMGGTYVTELEIVIDGMPCMEAIYGWESLKSLVTPHYR